MVIFSGMQKIKRTNRGNLTLIFNLIVFSLLSVLITLGADTILNSNLTRQANY